VQKYKYFLNKPQKTGEIYLKTINYFNNIYLFCRTFC